MLTEPAGLASSFASDPSGSSEAAPLSFYANPHDPAAGYLHANWWDEEPTIPDGQTVDISGREGTIGLAEGLGQLAIPASEGWIRVISSGLDIAQLEAAGESAVDTSEDGVRRVVIEPAGLPSGWSLLDADPLDFVTVVQVDDPTLPDAWVVRYDQPEPHEGTDLHAGFLIIGQPANDDLLVSLEALASEYEPADVRGVDGVALTLGQLGSSPPIDMNGIAWNEDGQTLIAVGLNRSSSDVAELVEDVERPTPDTWDELTT